MNLEPIIYEEEARVELATLILPPSAVDAGVRLGDGAEFVLEATAEIVDSAIDQTRTAQIEGVVDLEKISDLVPGVTEEEFVEIFHEGAKGVESGTVDDSTSKSEQSNESLMQPHSAEEEIPLIDEKLTSSVVLSADPFVETLTKTVPTSTDASGAQVTLLDTTMNENDDKLAHDAFLLSIPKGTPKEQEEGVVDNFVLALPEIQCSEEASMQSDTSFPSLVRRFSALPTDVQHVELHATTTSEPITLSAVESNEGEIRLDLVVERKVPIIGYVILVTGLFALASVGAALDMQGGGMSDTMKCFWRLNATSVALLPLAAKSLRWEEINGKLSWTDMFVWLPICACSYAFATTAFIVALGLTSLANSFILSNMASLIIILSKAALGLPVLMFEGIGAVIGIFGALVCSAAHATSIDQNESLHQRLLLIASKFLTPEMIGDLIAFLSSVGTAIYLVIAKDLRNKINLFVFMFSLFTLSSLFLLVYMILSGEYVEFSTNPTYGIFGWMTPVADRLPLELYMAIVCNTVGTTGYIAVMKYFDPVVISMVMLSEPVVAAFISIAVGVEDNFPGLQVWIGDAFVAIGSIMVIYSGSRKTEKYDATNALITPKVTLKLPSSTPGKTIMSPIVAKSPLLIKSPVRKKKGDRVIWD